jgi:hypothetical protein
MIYVFDTSTLVDLFRHYYESRFPSLWVSFAQMVDSQRVISVSEVWQEISQRDDRLAAWGKAHRDFFEAPVGAELQIVAQIFAVPHFQAMVRTQQTLQGKPVADPFVIAKAKVIAACVVADEEERPNSAKIPNVCRHFGVGCLNLEGFMERENWTF